MISIAMRSGDNAKLERWVEKKQLKMPVINDENGALSQQWAGERNADAGHCVEGECGQHHDGLERAMGIKIKDVVGRRIKITLSRRKRVLYYLARTSCAVRSTRDSRILISSSVTVGFSSVSFRQVTPFARSHQRSHGRIPAGFTPIFWFSRAMPRHPSQPVRGSGTERLPAVAA